jgi:glycosyltransferase involved in cell wall biosynthesis
VRLGRALVATGSLLAAAGTAHAWVNLRRLRVPPADPPPVAERVTVLIPARNEAHRIAPTVRSVLDQLGLSDLRVEVLDDASSDGTADVVRRVAGGDPRLSLRTGSPVPDGWWGKTWACHQLAAGVVDVDVEAGGGAPAANVAPAVRTVLVFLDADVVLAPHAVASAVSLLRWSGLDLLSPWPRQVATTAAERLVQPLQQWSWLTTLPVRVAERSSRPSTVAVNGQFLVVDAAAYRRAGGHRAVHGDVLDDIGLARAVRISGGRTSVADGTSLASCRMYDGWPALREGYGKSLWSAFGSPAGAAAVLAGLGIAYVVPPVAALGGSRVGLAGYLAAVAGRALVARRVRGRVWPDSLAHPASVGLLGVLTVTSLRARRCGTIRVAGRPLP